MLTTKGFMTPELMPPSRDVARGLRPLSGFLSGHNIMIEHILFILF